jgi:hypothetical protein
MYRDGRQFSGHVATVTSTGIDKTSPQGTPGVPASSYPIKGQTRALKGARSKPEAKHKQAKVEEQQTTVHEKLISFVLSLSL